MTKAAIAILTSSHEASQIAAAKFLADSPQKGDTWHFIAVAAIQAAICIPHVLRGSARAKSIRHLISRAIYSSPDTVVIAAVNACKGAQVPLHVSELLEKWATKYTAAGPAPAWHQVLASLSLDDKIKIVTHGPSRVSIQLVGPSREGDPLTHMLWNVNGFSSRWRSSLINIDLSEVVAGNARQTKKKRQHKRRIAKADFKAMVLEAGCPDLISIAESKLSLSRLMALPGFVSWCEVMGYYTITLSWSTSEAKGGAGYAGIMTLSKCRPLSTTFGLPGGAEDEARCVTHEFDSFVTVTVYSPCVGYDEAKMASRAKFDRDLREHIVVQQQKYRKPVICCGDLNVNPRRQDWHEKAFASMARVKEASGCDHHPGYSPAELKGYEQLLRSTNLTNAWEFLYPYSEEGMTWHPPTDPLGHRGWGQRLDHFLLSPEFLSERWKYSIDSMTNFRGQGSSDHNPVLIKLRRPHDERCSLVTDVTGVEILSLDSGKSTIFLPAKCPRVTMEISGKPAQVFIDTGSPFSIYNPPPGPTASDHFITSAVSTGSQSNCSFTGATGGRVTAEQNYNMVFKIGPHELQGEFVVLKRHEPNLPLFLMGMDILMGQLRGVAVVPHRHEDRDKLYLHFGVAWGTPYPCELFVQTRPPSASALSSLSPLQGLSEELIEENLPTVARLVSTSPQTTLPDSAFVYGGESSENDEEEGDDDFDPEDYSYHSSDEGLGFHDSSLPIVKLPLVAAGVPAGLIASLLVDSGSSLNLISAQLVKQLIAARGAGSSVGLRECPTNDLPAVRVASGQQVKSLGCIDLQLKLPGDTVSELVPFFIMPGLPVQAIIGHSTNTKWGAKLCWATRTWQVDQPDGLGNKHTVHVPWFGTSQHWRGPLSCFQREQLLYLRDRTARSLW